MQSSLSYLTYFTMIIDSTYKINIIPPLLEIIGVTFTDVSYSIVFDFLECEKEDNAT